MDGNNRKRSSGASQRPPLPSSNDVSSVNVSGDHGPPDSRVTVPNSATDEEKPSFSFKKLSSDKKWTVLLLAFANFAACTCFSLLAPFFPSEAAKKGASQTVIGLIFSCFELVIFLSAPLYGNFLTQIGSRFMFTSGLFVCASCAILFGVLDKCSPGHLFITMCFLVRSVEALGASAFITASFAIIANEFPNHVSTVFGALETFSGLGLMVGPPIGGALFELGGFGLPFWVMGGLLIICTAVTAIFLPSKPDHPQKKGSYLDLMSGGLVVVTLLTVVTGAFSLGFLDSTLSVFLSQFHLGTVYIGLIFILAASAYAFTAPLWGYLSDSKGIYKPLIIGGNIVGMISFLLLGPSPLLPFLEPKLWLPIVALILLGLGVGCAMVSTIKCLVHGAKLIGFEDNLDTFGLVSGLFNSAFSLGTFIGPTVGSTVLDHEGFGWAATLSAGIFAVSTVTFIVYISVDKCCEVCCHRQPSSHQMHTGDSEISRRLLGESSHVTYSSTNEATAIGSNNDSVVLVQDHT